MVCRVFPMSTDFAALPPNVLIANDVTEAKNTIQTVEIFFPAQFRLSQKV